jgi:hypothetical protein
MLSPLALTSIRELAPPHGRGTKKGNGTKLEIGNEIRGKTYQEYPVLIPSCLVLDDHHVRVSSLLMGQPIVAQALLVLSLLNSQTLLPS